MLVATSTGTSPIRNDFTICLLSFIGFSPCIDKAFTPVVAVIASERRSAPILELTKTTAGGKKCCWLVNMSKSFSSFALIPPRLLPVLQNIHEKKLNLRRAKCNFNGQLDRRWSNDAYRTAF